MQGSVRKRGTTWSYRIDFGKIDGKRRQIEKGGYKNKKEADKALADALYQVNNYGEFVENQKITFSEVFDEFITTEAPATRAYATIKRYNSLYRNHYQGKFGGLFVYQISANMVNDFLNEKRLKYSEEYVKGLYKTLKVIISFAYKKKYIKKNIFDEVTAPPDPRHISEIRAYSKDELKLMSDRLKETNIKTSFYIALNTGLRESEVFGLRWQDTAAYPNTEYQHCIVHQVRNTLKYVAEKDKKAFANDLKSIYHAPNEESGYERMQAVTKKWRDRYPNVMKRWEENWDVISPMFKFSADVRKVMYTTNAIESLNSALRRLNSQRSVFPSDTALLKALY